MARNRTVYYMQGLGKKHRSKKCAEQSDRYACWDLKTVPVPDDEYMPDWCRRVLPNLHSCLRCWHYDEDKTK